MESFITTRPTACVVGSTDQISFLPFHLKLDVDGAGLLCVGGADDSGAGADGSGDVDGAGDDAGGADGEGDADVDGAGDEGGGLDVLLLPLLHAANREKHNTSTRNSTATFFIFYSPFIIINIVTNIHHFGQRSYKA